MKELEQNGYSHITHLAAGGEGNVYICEKGGGKFIAKVTSMLDPEQLNILKSINTLRSEHFPRIIDFIADDEKTIIIREYIEGTTLSEEIKKNGSFSYKRAKEVVFDVCTALRVLHAMKPHPIIYRDLNRTT